MTVPSLIEQWFPAAAVGAESLRERGASSALPPVNFLHVWWARRPLTSARAAIVASLIPAWPTDEQAAESADAARVRRGLETEFPAGVDEYRSWFIQAIGILGDPVAARRAIKEAVAAGGKTKGNAYGYDRAFTVSPSEDVISRVHELAALRTGAELAVPVTLDPFAGGGSIPFEAARLGCDALANELNPVACAILNGTVVLPAELGPEFADVIRFWGNRWSERVRERLAGFFPHEHPDERLAYIWAHTVPCPSTGRPTPLAPDYWVAHGKAGRNIAVKVLVDNESGRILTEIIEGKAAAEWGDRSTYKQGVGTSVWTGETFSGEYIRERAQAGEMGELLLAVSVTRADQKGRVFRAPSSADLDATADAYDLADQLIPSWEIEDLIPTEEIPFGTDTRPQKHGILRWFQMLSKRQLLTTVTALEELHSIVSEVNAELGADSAKALNLYLGLALDKCVDYNGMLASWHSSRTTVRNTFDRHDFSFKWSFAEFDGASALLPWAVDQMVDAYSGIANLAYRATDLFEGERRAVSTVYRGSATQLSLPDSSVDAVITDPPYYDNVMYAECSDYFYVWLKRSLRSTWPELCSLPLTDKESEAVANPSLFADVAKVGRGRKKPGEKSAADLADERYEDLLTQSFRETHRVLREEGVLTVMFTHKRVDAWDTLGQALLESGFEINSSWPVHTESEHSLHQANKNSAASTIFLTCRKRGDTEPAYWSDIRNEVATAARESAERFAADGLIGIDLTIATFGPVLSVLSRNWPVYTGELGEDGQPEILRPDAALDLAREEVARLKKRGLLGGRDVEFDRVTDWYLLAWTDFAAAEFPYDEGRKLSIALHLDMDDLAKNHKVVRATSGKVTLLTPAQRRTANAIDPDAGGWPTLIDALHSLMLVYEDEGLPAARAWLANTGNGENPKFHDLVRAAIYAVPRVKDKGDFARPEARVLEGLRATLFEDIEAPLDPSELEVDGPATLFDAD